MEVPKFPKLGFPRFWGPISLCADLWLRWGLKQSCSLHWELSNDMSHTTYTQGNWVNSRLLVVGSQTANLTPDLSFGHNLCFRCPNGSCEPILNIYVLIAFQWYNFFFNKMGFDPWNCLLKIRESIGTPTFKMGVHLGGWGFIPSHSFAFPGAWDVTPELPSWPATLQALALVESPRLRLWHPPFNLPLVLNSMQQPMTYDQKICGKCITYLHLQLWEWR
jgi:hypothetical protein